MPALLVDAARTVECGAGASPAQMRAAEYKRV